MLIRGLFVYFCLCFGSGILLNTTDFCEEVGVSLSITSAICFCVYSSLSNYFKITLIRKNTFLLQYSMGLKAVKTGLYLSLDIHS